MASEKEKNKHYVAKFVHLMKTGCVHCSNMMEIQEEIFVIIVNKKLIIWLLGPKINVQYDSPNFTMNSSQTYFVDLYVDDELTRLHGEVFKVFKVTKKACLLHEKDQATFVKLKVDLDRRIT
jgi:hypothetical protein